MVKNQPGKISQLIFVGCYQLWISRAQTPRIMLCSLIVNSLNPKSSEWYWCDNYKKRSTLSACVHYANIVCDKNTYWEGLETHVTAPNTGHLLKYARLMRETRIFLERSCNGNKKVNEHFVDISGWYLKNISEKNYQSWRWSLLAIWFHLKL